MYKVVIADDEYIIRQGIVSLIDWKELNCEVVYEAENGNETVDFLMDHPVDILICDIRMPGKNGLEVAETVQKLSLPVRVILLTAYSDFEYARQAIRHGVEDYVVKTDYIEKLPESVRKTIGDIEKKREQEKEISYAKEKLNDSMQKLRENFVADLIRGIVREDRELTEQASWCRFPPAPFYLVNFIFSSDSIWKISESRREKTLKAVKNFIGLSLTKYDTLTVLLQKTDYVTLVFTGGTGEIQEKSFIKKLNSDLEELGAALQDTLGIRVNISFGSRQDNVWLLHTAYETVHSTNIKACFFEHSGVERATDENGQEEPECLDFLVKRILDHIEGGFYEDAKKELKQYYQEIMTEKYSMKTIRSRAIDICCECRRIIEKKYGAVYKNAEIHVPEYHEIAVCHKAAQLYQILTEAVDTVSHVMDADIIKEYSPLVQSCLSYIKEHYSEKINIGTIAENLYVNKSYLGTVFKKETGISIVETITKYRLDKAVELMQHTKYKLFEISEKVGFDDPAYFTNVFTKYMGISPSAYRGSAQEIK